MVETGDEEEEQQEEEVEVAPEKPKVEPATPDVVLANHKFTVNKSTFLDVIGYMRSIVDECVIRVYKGRVQMIGIDASHISIVDVSMQISAGKVSKEKYVVSLMKLERAVKGCGGDQITYSTDKAVISIVGNKGRAKFTMFCLSLAQTGDTKLPPLDPEQHVTITSPIELQKAVKNMVSYGASTQFKMTIIEDPLLGKSLSLLSEGDQDSISDVLQTEIKSTSAEESEDTVASSYPLDYFSGFTKLIKPSDKVEIHFHTDYPTIVEVEREDEFVVKALIAPRIET